MVNNSEEIIRRQLYSPADRDNRPDAVVNGTRARYCVVVVMLIISLAMTNGEFRLSLYFRLDRNGHSLGVSRASRGISFNWTVFPICLQVSVAFRGWIQWFEGREGQFGIFRLLISKRRSKDRLLFTVFPFFFYNSRKRGRWDEVSDWIKNYARLIELSIHFDETRRSGNN